MGWRKALLLVLAIDLVVLAVLAVIFSRLGVPVAEREFLGLRSLFPAGDAKPASSGEWRGFVLPHRFRIFSRDFDQPVDLQAMLRRSVPDPFVITALPLGDGGWYALKRRRKGHILYAVFRVGGRVFWLDMISNSTLDHARRAFHECLCRMQIGGRPIAAGLEAKLGEINRSVSPLFIQTAGQLMLFLAGLFMVIWLVLYAAMRWAGARPAQALTATLCTPGATMASRGLGTNSMACCLCLEGNKIVAYRFKRRVLAIDLDTEKKNLVLEKNRIRHGRHTFILDEEDFQRWRMMVSL